MKAAALTDFDLHLTTVRIQANGRRSRLVPAGKRYHLSHRATPAGVFCGVEAIRVPEDACPYDDERVAVCPDCWALRPAHPPQCSCQVWESCSVCFKRK